MNRLFCSGILLLSAPIVFSQQPQKRTLEHQSTSTISHRNESGSEVLEIKNVVYELTGSGISGRPKDERLVLRKTTRTKQIVDEVGMTATATVEAWPLGVDPKEKPLYSITVPGSDPVTLNSEVVVISRGIEEVDWWSAYKLGSGQHLFDTYVPVVQFSISKETRTLRYVGLQVPTDEVADRRLKAPNVVAVLTYASAERVIREALLTSDNPKTAQFLRSLADSTRTVLFDGNRIRLSITQNYPQVSKPLSIDILVTSDDLDVARSQAPAGLHVELWKR